MYKHYYEKLLYYMYKQCNFYMKEGLFKKKVRKVLLE